MIGTQHLNLETKPKLNVWLMIYSSARLRMQVWRTFTKTWLPGCRPCIWAFCMRCRHWALLGALSSVASLSVSTLTLTTLTTASESSISFMINPAIYEGHSISLALLKLCNCESWFYHRQCKRAACQKQTSKTVFKSISCWTKLVLLVFYRKMRYFSLLPKKTWNLKHE